MTYGSTFKLIATSAALIGALISSPTDAKRWVRDQTPMTDAQQDEAECKYEAARATATIGSTGRPPKAPAMRYRRASAAESNAAWRKPGSSRNVCARAAIGM